MNLSRPFTAILLAGLSFLPASAADSAQPKGYLLIEGGSNPISPVIAEKFRALIGGSASPVLIIPTGADEDRIRTDVLAGGLQRIAGELGVTNYRMFHTTSRKEADSDAFVAPLRTARGVWFTGGRPGRIVEAYLGTRVQRELQALYERGGVIGGVSAGAMAMGAFLVKGDPDDLSIYISARNQTGLGFLKNAAIDAHVGQLHSEGALNQVIAVHHDLLGIGLDAGTAIVVHDGAFDVIGGKDARAILTDGKPHGGKPYYFLKLGDHYPLSR